jgi:hypothetical protein
MRCQLTDREWAVTKRMSRQAQLLYTGMTGVSANADLLLDRSLPFK